MITKNLPDTEEREEEKRWSKGRIYILEVLTAISSRCGAEHMLFFILSGACHRLSGACHTLAIASALGGAPLLHRDEWDIRHNVYLLAMMHNVKL